MSPRARLYESVRAARAGGVAVTRAERLAGGPRADASLAEIAGWPHWPGMAPDAREHVWRLAALVAARDALPDVIDGATLRAYAVAVGEPALEALLDLEPGGGDALPPADALGEAGRRIAEHGLPVLLARANGIEAIGDADAARHVAMAERIAA